MRQMPAPGALTLWLDEMVAAKGSRYLRDTLKILERDARQYSEEVFEEALQSCRGFKVFNANQLMHVAETIRKREGEPVRQNAPDLSDINVQTLSCEVTVERSSISTYDKILEAI